MGRGKRYDNEPKLNIKKVIGAILAIIVFIMIILSITKIIKDGNNTGKITATNYFSVLTQGKWGVINSNGEIVIEPTYDEMIIVPNSSRPVFLCVYDINDTEGTYKTKVINEIGQEILKDYEKVEALDNYDNSKNIWHEENVLKVQKDGMYGLIDFKGKELLKCEYDEITTLKGIDNSIIIKKEDKLGLVNNVGQIIIEPEYKEILKIGEQYKNGYIVKNNEEKTGVININGVVVIPVKYDEVKYIKSTDAFYVKENETKSIVGVKEEKILDKIEYEPIEIQSDNIVMKNKDKYGVVNTKGETIIPFEYEELSYLFNEYYMAKKDGKYGVINIKNETSLDFEYIRMVYRKDANFIEAQKTELESIIYNEQLKEVVTGIISEVNNEKGYIRIYTNNEYQYYNFKFEKKNNVDILTTNTLFLSKKDGKYGYVNKNGEIVVDYIYEDATEQNQYGFCAVKQNGMWGCIDKIGKQILEPSINLDNNLFVEFIGKWHLVDSGVYYTK